MTESQNQEHFEAALSNCAREPVHIPGRVQDFAALLAYDLSERKIRYCSANLEKFGLPAIQLGTSVEELGLSDQTHHTIKNLLGLPTIHQQPEQIPRFLTRGDRGYQASLHRVESLAVLEIESAAQDSRSEHSLTQVRGLLSAIRSSKDLSQLLDSACHCLRHYTGFDRVMAYRFFPNGDGEVLAEARSRDLHPYLNLRYPAADIPSQVRRTMIEYPFRCIANTSAEVVPILSEDGVPALDMTLVQSRGVSVIHLEYLENMGVRSTMNLPILVRGQLWGLLAFHHTRPRLLPSSVRNVCELFGQLFSFEVQQVAESQQLAARKRAHSFETSLQDRMRSNNIDQVLRDVGPDLLQVFDVDGVAILHRDDYFTFGSTIEESTSRKLFAENEQEVVSMDSLKLRIPEWDAAMNRVAGALLVPFGPGIDTALLLFRDEEVQRVRWAGPPDKRISFGPNGPRLHPRASFAEWVELMKGYCRTWSAEDLAMAMELRHSLLACLYRDTDELNKNWKRQKEFQDVLIAELNHRVKNVLSLVRSIARQTSSGTSSVGEYVSALEQRITALATAHDLVGGSGAKWVPWQSILDTELRPYQHEARQIRRNGPAVHVRNDAAPLLCLILHELATNAAKYGALSGRDGSLEIQWREQGQGLEVSWVERCQGNPDDAVEIGKSGFGLSLIRHAFPHEFGGESSVDLTPTGVQARFWLPSQYAKLQVESVSAPGIARETRDLPAVSFGPCLILEDNYLLAQELSPLLKQNGVRETHLAGSSAAALELIDSGQIEIATLDVHLGGEQSLEVARVLLARKIPFLFITGYAGSLDLPSDLADTPVLPKPLDGNRLLQVLHELKDARQ